MKKSAFKYLSLGCVSLTLLSTAACEHQSKTALLERDGHYWQRLDTASAIYLRGPKAQQTLNQDLSHCVVGVKELERLGAINKAIPGKKTGDKNMDELNEFETPDRLGYNRREYLDYHDFESCMFSKGWERVEYVPYDVADRSLNTYQKTHVAFSVERVPTPQEQGDFNDLNE